MLLTYLFLFTDWVSLLKHNHEKVRDLFLIYSLCCSVSKSCLTHCDPKDCSMPDFPVLHYSPWVCSNSCPSSWWCHPTISSSVISFSSCLQSFPASGSFPMSQLFTSCGQSTGASASASVLPINIQSWFSLGVAWFDLALFTAISQMSKILLPAIYLASNILFIVDIMHKHLKKYLYLNALNVITECSWVVQCHSFALLEDSLRGRCQQLRGSFVSGKLAFWSSALS